jgi:hypothetical protein
MGKCFADVSREGGIQRGLVATPARDRICQGARLLRSLRGTTRHFQQKIAGSVIAILDCRAAERRASHSGFLHMRSCDGRIISKSSAV